MEGIKIFALVVIAVIVLAVFASCIVVVKQAQAMVVERIGAYKTTWSVGLHWKWPIIDRIARRVTLKDKQNTSIILIRHLI